jgi:hypothetical protein
MKKLAIMCIAFIITLLSCNGQYEKKADKNSKTNAPNTDIKVNKEYDKNGNLIKYDSTYSSYYSHIGNNSILGDSILKSFKNHFNQKYLFSNEPFFNDLFFQDSLLRYDFYKKDFFSNRFKKNMEEMNKLFWEMDTVKNNFFKDQFKPKSPTQKYNK